MSDRRAVSAGHLAASSAAVSEPWRVAVGGNRVENMSVEQIARAYRAGQLSARTPLWPPGSSGWQALGNFDEFRAHSAAPPAHNDPFAGARAAAPAPHPQFALAQFEEGDDDPTRMWTGSMEDLGAQPPMPPPAPPSMHSAPPPARPSVSTGIRPAARAPQPVSAQPVRPMSPPPSAAPMSEPPFRRKSQGWLLVAGLVGLVGLGSAVLAARGGGVSSAPSDAPKQAVAAATASSAKEKDSPSAAKAGGASVAEASEKDSAQAKAAEGEPARGAQLAKYDDSSSAFVADAKKGAAEPEEGAASKDEAASDDEGDAKPERSARHESSAKSRSVASTAGRRSASKAERHRNTKERPRTEKAALASKRAVASAQAVEEPAPKAEPKPKDEPKAEASAAAAAPASAAVNEAAAAALGNAANLASSCRPRGGPSGDGKARVIYSNDGEVQQVEILTAKFRDTLTASCVRMVFRRAKIPPFKGEPPTFIKSFTIPAE